MNYLHPTWEDIEILAVDNFAVAQCVKMVEIGVATREQALIMAVMALSEINSELTKEVMDTRHRRPLIFEMKGGK